MPAWLGARGALRVAAATHVVAWGTLVGVVQQVEGGAVAWLALLVSALFFVLMYVPAIPIPKRFFPISTLAGIAGALAPMI
jgi:4-hydroxybenzoate polyprenyltransferase